MIYPRTCRLDLDGCGRSFQGARNTRLCPDCRKRHHHEAVARYKERKKLGLSRVMGGEDACEICGGAYTIDGSKQRYCRECSPAAVYDAVLAQAADTYHKHKETVLPIRNARARTARRSLKPCRECGEIQPLTTKSPVCPKCRPAWLKNRQREYDARRKKKKNTKPTE